MRRALAIAAVALATPAASAQAYIIGFADVTSDRGHLNLYGHLSMDMTRAVFTSRIS